MEWERKNSKEGKRRIERDHETKVGSKVGLKDRYYRDFKCLGWSYPFLQLCVAYENNLKPFGYPQAGECSQLKEQPS